MRKLIEREPMDDLEIMLAQPKRCLCYLFQFLVRDGLSEWFLIEDDLSTFSINFKLRVGAHQAQQVPTSFKFYVG